MLDGIELYQAFEHGFYEGSIKHMNDQQKHDMNSNKEKVMNGFVSEYHHYNLLELELDFVSKLKHTIEIPFIFIITENPRAEYK